MKHLLFLLPFLLFSFSKDLALYPFYFHHRDRHQPKQSAWVEKNLSNYIKTFSLENEWKKYLSHKDLTHLTSAKLKKITYKQLRKKLPQEFLDVIATEYAKQNPDTYTVCLYPAGSHNLKKVDQTLSRYGKIIHYKDIFLKNRGPLEAIRVLYDNEPWIGGWHDAFERGMGKASRCFPNEKLDQPFRIYLFEPENPKHNKEMKWQIRNYLGVSFDSVHINDCHSQTVTIASTFFNDNSINLLNTRRVREIKPFDALFENFRTQPHHQESYIEGDAVLSLYGIRFCETLSTNTSLEILRNPQKHLYYKDVKFITLDVLREMKQKRKLPQDITDLKLIDDFNYQKSHRGWWRQHRG